jgi:hypothetical protein
MIDPTVAMLAGAVAAEFVALMAQSRDHSKKIETLQAEHHAEVKLLLEEQIEKTERASEKLAEASRLARSLLPPTGRY